ncbi:uncharacterized protein LOC104905614 isoform X1 [Beta vulgaris subsp. vulgaris]|uniref:uncharacterized protein LOC104905614 isoform X1 n=1 Tax=Beta vulgaris subsp. vulgaris TaxID=3555 RepID=UPI0020368861|nr:uncharacterized protein LOC104905614 isoform X1 [Beta vulgaris subsp. vulgaris]XP_048502646.1 uncharacterized protein LOC104905614 isoform X1 [Beta vulgaris subsp. vulgaris]
MGKAIKDVSSSVTAQEIDELKRLGNFPEGAQIIVPSQTCRPESCPEDYICYYEHPFLLGYNYNFSPLTRSFMEVLHLSPGQLMPALWKTCSVLETLTNTWHHPFSLNELLTAYSVRKSAKGFITLRAKAPYPPLIDGTIASDYIWKTRYFFVVKDSIGEAGNSLVGGWFNQGLGPIIFQKPEQAERLADLFNLPIEERTYVAPAEIIPLESKIFSRTNSMSSAQAKSSTLSDEDAMDRLKNRKRSAASSGHS